MAQAMGPAAKRRKLNFSEDVKLIVGQDEQRFTSHKDLLCSRSAFFRAALNGDFREAHERTIRLPDIEPETFRAYLQWISTDAIVVADPEEAERDENGELRRTALIKLYIAGDLLCDTLLRNTAVDEIVALEKSLRWGLSDLNIALAYAKLPETSKLRLYMVHTSRAQRHRRWLEQAKDILPKQFFVDLVLFLKTPQGQRDIMPPTCTYHDHDAEVPACVGPQQDRRTIR